MNKTEISDKLYEAYKKGYIRRCPKCKSFMLSAYVDENYFSDMLRWHCKDCKHECGDSKFN